MSKTPHTNPDVWPTPLGLGILVELDFKEKDTNLEVPGGNLYNLTSGVVRAVSPHLPTDLAEEYLPEGQGSEGIRVLAPESSFDYLDDELYETVGLTVPSQDNNYGELVFINDLSRIIAIIPDTPHEDMELPFDPLGSRVFVDFEYDERSADVVDPDSGETYSRMEEDDDKETNNIVVPESSYAQSYRVATVEAVGPDVEHVEPGDQVIPPETCDSINYDDEEYFFVNSEAELVAVL